MKEATYIKGASKKKYPFSDSDLSEMLDNLLKNGIIELLTPKRPQKAGRTTNPK